MRSTNYLRSALIALLALGIIVFLTASGGAQGPVVLRTLDTPNPQARAHFGSDLAMGDANGDGRADIAVSQTAKIGGYFAEGRAYLFDGVTGATLFTLDSPNPQAYAQFGFSLAMGDADGDGHADLLVGAALEDVGGNTDQGRAYLFSGTTGALLRTLDIPNPQAYAQFGRSLAMGNADGDGHADLLVGAPYGGVQRAYLFSGTTGTLLHTLEAPSPQSAARFGVSLAMGDADGDGRADIAVGAPEEDVGSNTDRGRAYLFDGASGSLSLILDTPNPQGRAHFGRSLAMGDTNGDGKADIAVGASLEAVGGNSDQGRAYVFSGDSGTLLLTLDNPNPNPHDEGNFCWGRIAPCFGGSLAMGDTDGDGKADIAVGAFLEDVGGSSDQGRAYVFSGDGGFLALTLDTPDPQSSQGMFGASLAIGDTDADGAADIAVSAPSEDVGGNWDYDQGRAYLFAAAAPTPPPSVGGIVDIAVEGSGSLTASAEGGSAGSSVPYSVVLAGAVGAGAIAVAAGAWYASRRWLR